MLQKSLIIPFPTTKMVVFITPSLARSHQTIVPFKSEDTLSPSTTAADTNDEFDAFILKNRKGIPSMITDLELSRLALKIVVVVNPPAKLATEIFQSMDE